jgi:DNA-binding transcriptional LysR family regulator
MQPKSLTRVSLAHKLKLNQLMKFDSVLETRSVVHAATEMLLTEPAVIKVIRNLESCFKGGLFERSNLRVQFNRTRVGQSSMR